MKTMILMVYNAFLFIIDVALLIFSSAWLSLESLYRIFIKPSKKPLHQDIVLVTGAGHGLGREMALEFSRRGATVVLLDINELNLTITSGQIATTGGKVHFYICDVSDRDEVIQVAKLVKEEVGYVSILVNNAAITSFKPLISTQPKDIRNIMDVNVIGQFWMLQAFLPDMLEKGKGHIVGLSSIAGRGGTANAVAYCATKYAVAGLMDALEDELYRVYEVKNIQFTTVFASFLNTGLAKNRKLRYPSLVPVTEPDEAAKVIIDGVQRNAAYVYIPRGYEPFLRLLPLLPRKVYHKLTCFLGIGVDAND